MNEKCDDLLGATLGMSMHDADPERAAALDRSALDRLFEYHERTKHRLDRYARSLGYMDWDSQPDPFRRYSDTKRIPLDHPPVTETPSYDSLFGSNPVPPVPITRNAISHLFYESLAISAWKQTAGVRPWSLRVNPSSGDLHPTEAYLLTGPIDGLNDVPGVFHYSAYEHALEHRMTFSNDEWLTIAQRLPAGCLLVALASIYWRESWKYGERAFRYCHHDVGHAIGAITFASAVLGWQTRVIETVGDKELATLLGLHRQAGEEKEQPDCLIAVFTDDDTAVASNATLRLPTVLLDRLEEAAFEGEPNQLSADHHQWPVIDDVAGACHHTGKLLSDPQADDADSPDPADSVIPDRTVSARKIIRQRRSAVAMDGHTGIGKETFYRMMSRLSRLSAPFPFGVLGFGTHVSLALFVHRVQDLEAGLYLLIRHRDHERSLRQSLRKEFVWEKPAGCPHSLNLVLLAVADACDAARIISCHQTIAADGAFALGMLAEFDATLRQVGPSIYPRLFWETGLIGQLLYLEAEVAGIRSTGIGCFFDDEMHEVLGIHDHSWQSLYHFTVGGAVEDQRLQTLPSYWHLEKGSSAE